MFFFFFSSRRRHTRCSRDWSSDVCSSDLRVAHLLAPEDVEGALRREAGRDGAGVVLPLRAGVELTRIVAQAWRGVLLGVDRDRHQVNPGRLRAELILKLLERPAGERADR